MQSTVEVFANERSRCATLASVLTRFEDGAVAHYFTHRRFDSVGH